MRQIQTFIMEKINTRITELIVCCWYRSVRRPVHIHLQRLQRVASRLQSLTSQSLRQQKCSRELNFCFLQLQSASCQDDDQCLSCFSSIAGAVFEESGGYDVKSRGCTAKFYAEICASWILHMCCIIVTRWGGPGKIEA